MLFRSGELELQETTNGAATAVAVAIPKIGSAIDNNLFNFIFLPLFLITFSFVTFVYFLFELFKNKFVIQRTSKAFQY